MALMTAAGWRGKDIAAKLGVSPHRISIIASSPLFKIQVDRLQKEMRESTVADVVHRIATEAGPSLDVLVELRDHAVNEHVRFSSARDILDRNPHVARVQKVEEDRTLRIVFGAPELRQMFGALLEDDGKPVPSIIETTALPVGPLGSVKIGGPKKARPLDEVIEEMEAAEAEL
jgi:hypothetical protein